MSICQKLLYSRHVTAITVPKHDEPSPHQEASGSHSTASWTVEQVLSAYGDFLAGRLRMPQLKSPTPLFGGKTLATLCYCWLTVTRQPLYDAYKELLKRRYKLGEILTPSEEQSLAPFRSSLQDSLDRYPFAPEHVVSCQSSPEDTPTDEALIPASLAAEILGVTLASLSIAATRGKIEGHVRRGQRLLIPVSYFRTRFTAKRG